MKISYPTQTVESATYNILPLFNITFGYIKQIADANAVQITACFRPEGIKVTFIKKLKDKSTRKRSVELDNSEMDKVFIKLQGALQEVLMGTDMISQMF
jgi:hypothetical protein